MQTASSPQPGIAAVIPGTHLHLASLMGRVSASLPASVSREDAQLPLPGPCGSWLWGDGLRLALAGAGWAVVPVGAVGLVSNSCRKGAASPRSSGWGDT